ncbi:MAG: acireductone synthase [Parvibaculum sp.]|uniref:acireductone synthase n=1 Tax=Parvibaculum sp. TaxID=2024848 RepID=UPI0025E434FD|nr:acireductone synthase [Parvibaculum sp.]MCE9649058.1 acireductone synthase [Parvibaculum sp.]
MPVRAILTDIEGTTTPIAFVHEVLFPYARARLADFCAAHRGEPEVAAALQAARDLDGHPDFTLDETVALLLRWMDEDRKAGPLKTLQGLIWRKGYEEGVLKGQVYEDAAALLECWHSQGLKLFVYSSGSEEAQKLIFGYSDKGDLTPLFGGFFDTRVGAKVEASSYRAIAEAVGIAPGDILFLSDLAPEIAAAKAAGFGAARIDRALDVDASHDEGGVLVAGSFVPVDRLLVQA